MKILASLLLAGIMSVTAIAKPLIGFGAYLLKVPEPELAYGFIPFLLLGQDYTYSTFGINIGFTGTERNEYGWITKVNIDLFGWFIYKSAEWRLNNTSFTFGPEIGGHISWDATAGTLVLLWPFLGVRFGAVHSSDTFWYGFHMRFVPYLGLIPEIAIGVTF